MCAQALWSRFKNQNEAYVVQPACWIDSMSTEIVCARLLVQRANLIERTYGLFQKSSNEEITPFCRLNKNSVDDFRFPNSNHWSRPDWRCKQAIVLSFHFQPEVDRKFQLFKDPPWTKSSPTSDQPINQSPIRQVIQPAGHPSNRPVIQPTSYPTSRPSNRPVIRPTIKPKGQTDLRSKWSSFIRPPQC